MPFITLFVNGQVARRVHVADDFVGRFRINLGATDQRRNVAKSIKLLIFGLILGLILVCALYIQRLRPQGISMAHISSDLMVLPEPAQDSTNGQYPTYNIKELDLVAKLSEVIDHPRRFLNARPVSTARQLAERVSGPMFGRPAPSWLPPDTLYNGTGDLLDWLQMEMENVCYTLRNLIVDEPHRSPDHHLLVLHAELAHACSKAWVSTGVGGLTSVRDAALDTLDVMAQNLVSFVQVLSALQASNQDLQTPYIYNPSTGEFLMNKFVQNWTTPLELAGIPRSATPGDLDHLTIFILSVLRGSPLLTASERDDKSHLFAQELGSDHPMAPPDWPTESIRRAITMQQDMFDTLNSTLNHHIIPLAQSYMDYVTEKGDRAPGQRDRTTDNSDTIEREHAIRSVIDGVDHLRFLQHYLDIIMASLPGLLQRLDR